MSTERLTIESWERWTEESSSIALEVQTICELFKSMKTSEILMENFLGYRDDIQKLVFLSLAGDRIITNCGVAAHLLNRLDIPAPKTESWTVRTGKVARKWPSVMKNDSVERAINQIPNFDSVSFEEVVAKFSSAQSGVEDNPFYQRDPITDTVPYLLALIHGQDRVVDVMKAWSINGIPHPLDQFYDLVENWEKVKTYPVEWALYMIQ